MARGRITLRDVARRVGVHPSTVSRVLNPETRGMVTPEIAGRVEEAASALGYRPNPLAYGLKTDRSLTVGVVIPDLTNPVFPPIIRAIEDTLGKAGYIAIIANSDNDAERERVILDRMRARRVDGLILATARREDPLVAGYRSEDLPLVLINRTVEDGGVSSVVNDDAAGIALSVAHLVGLGHRRIAHIAGPQELSTGYDRYRAFVEAMRERRVAADPALVAFSDAYSVAAGRRALMSLLEAKPDFTAVIAGNDLLALGCYEALQHQGLRCPEDISVTGFNDMPLVDKTAPPLTTVRIPHYDMGAQAARILLARIDDGGAEIETVRLPSELVVRGSTARP